MRGEDLDFTIARLGECRIPSPMSGVRFARDDERVLCHASFRDMKSILGSSRGPQAPAEMVEMLESLGIGVLASTGQPRDMR